MPLSESEVHRIEKASNVITGKTKVFYMIADPIDHVRTPEVMNPIFEREGIDAIMVPLHLTPDSFEQGWKGILAAPNVGGMVVSVPHKAQALELSDHADSSATDVSAANTVRKNADGTMTCANFDGAGFMAGVMNEGRDVQGKSCLLIGAGGAGSSIAFELAKAGATRLHISDINIELADDLAAQVRNGTNLEAATAGAPDPTGFDVVVNASPCGLHPETDPHPLDFGLLTADMLVADIVMKPKETPLLKAAEAVGCEIRYGAGMLDKQIEKMMRFFGYELQV